MTKCSGMAVHLSTAFVGWVVVDPRHCSVAYQTTLPCRPLCYAVSAVPTKREQETSLLLLKGAMDPTGSLSSWQPSTDYCTWEGIGCNGDGLVTTM